MFLRFNPAYYLNNAQALRSALIGAGVSEDIAAIAAKDAITYDKLWTPEYLTVGFCTWLGSLVFLLVAISAYSAAAFFGGWPAIIGVGLCIAMSFVGMHLLTLRYVKAYRAYQFAMIALGRSAMIAGPANCAALDSAKGLSGEDYIRAVVRKSRFAGSVFFIGLVFALTLFLMSSPGHALTHR